jgi:dTDP-glucose pyrophosphorylase
MWGIIPAAGAGSRIQPLAFSKELLPVGSRHSGGVERPRAVSEYIVERMILGGATRICFVISPGKSDILEYFGGAFGTARMCYTVQPAPIGLCDAIFCALPFVQTDEPVLVGLPDTIWFPPEGFSALSDDRLSFLLFPVERPDLFDSVLTDDQGRVREIRVKDAQSGTHWVWGAFKMPFAVLRELHQLWRARGQADEYFGTLVNAYIGSGGEAFAVRGGEAYVDVGTLNGYREAMRMLSSAMPEAHGPALNAGTALIGEEVKEGRA